MLLHFYRSRHLLPAEDILKEVEAWDGEYRKALDNLRAQASEIGADFDEMLVTVHDNYVAIVIYDYLDLQKRDPDTVLLIEERIDLSVFVPEGFGSSDAIIVSGKIMTVYDLKYGKGVKVFAEHNPQMMCYALGALVGQGETYPVEEVEMCIIQPRLQHVSRHLVSAQYLLSWGFTELQPAADLAFKGLGDLVPGDHCRFCAVAPRCKALAQKARTLSTAGAEPALMSLSEIAGILPELDAIKTWIASVENYALEKAIAGETIPGYKLVEGRSIRKISDQAAAMKVLQDAGFEESSYCRPKELKTITDLERLLKKKGFQELLGNFVEKPQGKPALAPDTDPRPELSSAELDFKDVEL